MSNTGFISATPHDPKYIVPKTSPVIVRVMDNTPERSLQKLKVKTVVVDDPEDDDVLTDAYDIMVEQAAVDYLAKQIEKLNAKEGNENDVEGGNPDPEVEFLLENVFDEDGEYVEEPKLDPITKEYVSAEQASKPHATAETRMTSDDDDIFAVTVSTAIASTYQGGTVVKLNRATFESEDPYDSLDPVEAFSVKPPKYIAKTNKENMKDEPYTGKPKAVVNDGKTIPEWTNPPFQKQDEEHGDLLKGIVGKQPSPAPLQFLKSVEGRVLTIMEAAIPDKEQRNAIKTLIKKEFRREMSKAGRLEIESDDGDD